MKNSANHPEQATGALPGGECLCAKESTLHTTDKDSLYQGAKQTTTVSHPDIVQPENPLSESITTATTQKDKGFLEKEAVGHHGSGRTAFDLRGDEFLDSGFVSANGTGSESVTDKPVNSEFEKSAISVDPVRNELKIASVPVSSSAAVISKGHALDKASVAASGVEALPGTSDIGLVSTSGPDLGLAVSEGALAEVLFAEAVQLTAKRWEGLPSIPEGADIERLRNLLFQREIAILERLKHRLDTPEEHARDVSSVVAEALMLRLHKDELLPRFFGPIVADAVKDSIKKHPGEFAYLMFPLMGPAIRRSIAESFRSMLENLNRSLELSLSWKGLRWRFEALRSGTSFSEVILLHTLVYRVEQIFFIHSETGLVLAHEVNSGVETQDADMVSAMLTAVQQFVRDCFAGGGNSDLESVRWGDATILVETNPYASLACIVRGTPPSDLRENLHESLDLLLLEYSDQITHFNGDNSAFAGAKRYLQDCLVSRFQSDDKPVAFWAKALPVLGVLLLACGLGYWQYSRIQAEGAMQAYTTQMHNAVEVLQQEPGYLVTAVKEEGRTPWKVFYLKDELSRDPYVALSLWDPSFDTARFSLHPVPFVSYEPAIITKRVQQKISLPETVTMKLLPDGVLQFNGTAPLEWILVARQDALTTSGVRQVDMKNLTDPRLQQLEILVEQIEKTVIEFPLGKDMPVPEDIPRLGKAVSDLVVLDTLAKKMGIAVSVSVYGHADKTGLETRNYELSQARARRLAAQLYAQGSNIPITLYAMGAEYAKERTDNQTGDQSSRKIELRVHLTQAVRAAPDILND